MSGVDDTVITATHDDTIEVTTQELIMLDWNNYRKELAGRIGEIAAISPDTIKGYQTLTGSSKKGGRLDAKTIELISLAVAVSLRCDGCIAVHTAEAVKLGASKEEIGDALSVAIALNAGATMVYSARVMDAYATSNTPSQVA